MARPCRPEIERFMSHVDKQSDGCWRWKACCLPNGYGQFSHSKRGESHELAHRASYRLFISETVPNLDVMHSCDHPYCVNPLHLRLGTRTDNMQDAKKKGRTARGIKHGRSKLAEKDIRLIMELDLSQSKIAKVMGISQSHVSNILAGKKWAHLSQESSH